MSTTFERQVGRKYVREFVHRRPTMTCRSFRGGWRCVRCWVRDLTGGRRRARADLVRWVRETRPAR